MKRFTAPVTEDDTYEVARRQALALLDRGFPLGGQIDARRDELHERVTAMSNIDRLRARVSPERREKIAARAAVIIADEQARLARRRAARRKRKTASQGQERGAR